MRIKELTDPDLGLKKSSNNSHIGLYEDMLTNWSPDDRTYDCYLFVDSPKLCIQCKAVINCILGGDGRPRSPKIKTGGKDSVIPESENLLKLIRKYGETNRWMSLFELPDKKLIVYLTKKAHADFISEHVKEFDSCDDGVSANIIESTISKPLILLAGISGTGKSRFVRLQAAQGDSTMKDPRNFCLVPVRPDWHEPSDLLGYVSRIREHDRYLPTEFLKFMVKAWDNAIDENCQIKKSGIQTYWLCLDEMNLAPVEQYFADYLSVLETREWSGGEYTCAPLLKSDVIKSLKESGLNALKAELMDGIESDKAEKLWARFLGDLKGIPLPPNLIVAGTVNMDETTHGFSRKVIDRALTLDFQEFFPNDFKSFLPKTQIQPITLVFPTLSHADSAEGREALKLTGDLDGEKTVEFMAKLNKILEGTPFELAYRALNECLLAVACQGRIVKADGSPTNEELEQRLLAVWDDFLMQKVLPRIEGDAAKLKFAGANKVEGLNDVVYGKESILHKLYLLLGSDCLKNIWGTESDAIEAVKDYDPKKAIGTRPDLLRHTDSQIICRSRKKLRWMMKRLKANHFTDFWV